MMSNDLMPRPRLQNVGNICQKKKMRRTCLLVFGSQMQKTVLWVGSFEIPFGLEASCYAGTQGGIRCPVERGGSLVT